jgi:hypothetical protein
VSEQSSTVVAFRAVVMLVCLTAIPLAALFGTSLPGVFKALKEGKWPLASTAQAQSSGGEAARFVPASQSSNAAPFAADTVPADTAKASTSQDPPAFSPRWPESARPQNPSPVVPASYETSSEQSEKPPQQVVAAQAPHGNPADRPANLTPVPAPGAELVPVDRASPGQPDARDANGLRPDPRNGDREPGGSVSSEESFRQVENRLRQLGATYYCLDTMADGRQWRFCCRMAVAGNRSYTRLFQAMDCDALRAMGQVLEQVESWRSGKP